MIKVVHAGVAHKVPCGKCGYCLQAKRSSWMFRVHYEMRVQQYPGYFLTLTYHPKYVRRVDGGRLSLRFRDIQLYLKKLRKAKYYCKYICVGEYGSETNRPHYHLLIWTDCPPVKLESIWFMGLVHFGTLSMASAMYTLKYIIQPKPPEYQGVERPRAQFSKGIGLGYLTTAMYNYHTQDYDDPVMWSYVDGKKVSLPRYYRSKIFTKYQLKRHASKVYWETIKLKRDHVRTLLKQGFKNPREYVQQLRAENAIKIIKKTKFNQSL